MLPEFYLNCLKSQLSASQLLTLEMLVWLLQFHKQVRLERLAACFPSPILYESRRRHIQRFLTLPQLSIPLLWFPLIKCILLTQIQAGTQVIVALYQFSMRLHRIVPCLVSASSYSLCATSCGIGISALLSL